MFAALLALTACSQSVQTGGVPSPTMTTAGTPTLAPPRCATQFGATYVTTLPDSNYSETTVYAQVPLPSLTRSYDDDASGLRVRFMCSAGTGDSVMFFMDDHLYQLGWQLVADGDGRCGLPTVPDFHFRACWKNGSYQLYLGVTSGVNWAIAYVDPAFK